MGPLGPLAQLVEQWTLNPLVEGSSPSRPTILPQQFGVTSVSVTELGSEPYVKQKERRLTLNQC